MRVAIIGGGFTGLATARALLAKGFSVTLFDKRPIGEGTSGAASGLMHPFPGFAARISLYEKEAMALSCSLIEEASEHVGKPLCQRGGLLRIPLNERQAARWLELSQEREDVASILNPPRFLSANHPIYQITSGVTVFSRDYLEALFSLCSTLAMEFRPERVESLAGLDGYDKIVVAAGYESRDFAPLDDFESIKGQALICEGEMGLVSAIGKGYLAVTSEAGIYHLGSTYERNYDSAEPKLDEASRLILPQAEKYLSDVKPLYISDVRGGVRLARRGGYLPRVKPLSERVWVAAGMGSRGLLYHALVGQWVAAGLASTPKG